MFNSGQSTQTIYSFIQKAQFKVQMQIPKKAIPQTRQLKFCFLTDLSPLPFHHNVPVLPHLRSQLQFLGFPLHLLLPPVSPRLGSQPSASRPAEQNRGGLRSSCLSPHRGINGVFVLQVEISSLVEFTWNWPVHSELIMGKCQTMNCIKLFFENQEEESKWFTCTCLV